MCKNNKQLETREQRRRRERRGKNGREAVIKDALADAVKPDSDVTPQFRPIPLLNKQSQDRVDVVRRGVNRGHYDHPGAPSALLETPRFLQDVQHSANVVAED